MVLRCKVEPTSRVTPVLGASSFQSVSMLKSHHLVRSLAVLPAQVEVATALEEVDVFLREPEETELEALLKVDDEVTLDVLSMLDEALTPDGAVVLRRVVVTDNRPELDDLIEVDGAVDEYGVEDLVSLVVVGDLTVGDSEATLEDADTLIEVDALAKLTDFAEVDGLLYVADLMEVGSLAVLEDLIKLDCLLDPTDGFPLGEDCWLEDGL